MHLHSQAADKCIELEPTFARGYSRKGACQFFMKEYDKALTTYKTGLKYDAENEEIKEGIDKCLAAISRFASGNATDDEIKERQAKSLADPEVQGLLKDPVMQVRLSQERRHATRRLTRRTTPR